MADVIYAKSIASTPRIFPATLHDANTINAASIRRAPRMGRARLVDSAEVAQLLRASFSRLPLPDTVLVDDLAQVTSRSWQDRIDAEGSASFDILDASPDRAGILGDNRDLVTFWYKGVPAFTQLVTGWSSTPIAAKEADEKWSYKGPGHLALLRQGLIEPSRGLRVKPDEVDRPFNWTSPVYDDSWWLPTAQVGLVSDGRLLGAFLSGVYVSLGLLPSDAPELAPSFWAPGGDPFGAASLEWQFGGTLELGQPLPARSGGTGYFRRKVGIPTTGDWKAWFTCSAVGDLYVDGQHILSAVHNATGHDFMNTTSGTVNLTAGKHTIAWTASNNPDSSLFNPAWNPGFAAWTLSPTDEHADYYQFDTLRPTQFLMSGAGDRMVVYVPRAPGMSVGQIMLIALREAQARGKVSWVDPQFDETFDSSGNRWPVTADISTKVGNDLLTFFLELVAAGHLELWMAPGTMKLYAWQKNGRGGIRPVTLATGAGGSVYGVALTGETAVAETLLVESPVGWESFGTGDVEALLSLGSQASESEVAAQAAATIAEFGQIREQRSITHAPLEGADPYVDYMVGDTITMPPDAAAKRVTGITVTERGDDVEIVTDDPAILTPEERIAVSMKKMSNGTGGGRFRHAQPIQRASIAPAAVPAGGAGGAGASFMLTTTADFEDAAFTTTAWTYPSGSTPAGWAGFVSFLNPVGDVADVVVTLLDKGVAYGAGPHSTVPVRLAASGATDRCIVLVLGIVGAAGNSDFTANPPDVSHPDVGTWTWNEDVSVTSADKGAAFLLVPFFSQGSLDFDGSSAPIVISEYLTNFPGLDPIETVAYVWNLYAVDGVGDAGSERDDVNTNDGGVGTLDFDFDTTHVWNMIHVLQTGTEAPLFTDEHWRRHITNTIG